MYKMTFLCLTALFLFFVSSLHAIPRAPRIIGGSTARAGQFPWQAAIYLDNLSGKYFCGGALLSDQWILTAAHCVYGVTQFTIHLGSNTLLSPDANRIILSTSTYQVHPQYNQNTLENDIGLIKLHLPITFTEYIRAISVANTGDVSDGEVATASGFGQIRDSAAGLTNNLQYVELAIISNNECQITYGSQIKSGMVCAVGNYNQGICIGDTGGPLARAEVEGEVLVGIGSFMSQNGCESTDPAGFTRVDVYHAWISNVTGIP